MLRFRSLSAGLLLCLGFLLILSGCGGGGSSTSSTQPSNPSNPSNPSPPSSGSTNPVPSIATLTPASVVAGSPGLTLAVAGSGFISASVVDVNGAPLTTTYASGSSLQAAVPASAIAADGTVKVTVTNPSPGGGTSAAQNYTITVPTPAITALSPQSVTQGAAVTITVTGTGFEANSVAQWNGTARPTTFVNATTLQVALTGADVQNFGTGEISVGNPGLPPTTPLELTVLANTPTITGNYPNLVTAYSGSSVPQQVSISGSGFALNATVQANGQPVPVLSQTATSITVSLAAGYFAAPGSISLVVTNPGPPAISSNSGIVTVTGPSSPSLTVSPNSAPAGSPDTTITLYGSGFYQDSVVSWNNTPLTTTYVSSAEVTAVIPASLLTGFAQASISVSAPENNGVLAPPQPFDTYLELPVNDIIYDSTNGFIYASIPGYAGGSLGNSVAAIDPTTGVIQNTIAVGSEPNRLALSSDGTQLFVGLNGAGAVRQVNLTTNMAGTQFSLGGGPGVYNPPYTAVGLAAVPGQPNSVAVSASNGVVTIYDSGVARANSTSGMSGFGGGNGGLAFGSSASVLYAAPQYNGSLYQLTVGATGITASTQLATQVNGSTLQYDNGELYSPSGVALNATTGNQVGQFSTSASGSTTPTAAAGPIVSDSTLNLAWILPSNYSSTNQLLSFNETTFDPSGSIPLTGIGSIQAPTGYNNPADLIRWGEDGLAFHTANQIYVLQGPIVKNVSNSPADVTVTVEAPATGTTGSTLTYNLVVQSLGPNTAQGVTLVSTMPESAIFGSISTSQGSCSGTGVSYCDLGSIPAGSSVTVTVTVTPTVSGMLEATGTVSSISYDPVSTNNQSSGSTTVTGSSFNAPPVVTQLSPALIQAGSGTFTLTVDGEGFTSASTVLWNGTALPTTLLSGGQLTVTVGAANVSQLGWALVSVSTPAPGGGQSAALPFSIYQLLNVPANAMTYDPFTRQLYAVLPSTSTSILGNSIVAINPVTGNVGSPVQVGSEPNLLSETSDGNYLYIGLSGAKSLGRFNLLTQSQDLTVPLVNNASYSPGEVAAIAIATVPGSDTSVAVENNSFNGIGILDISGTTGTFRENSSSAYSGDDPVFTDPTHFYAYDASTTGAEFYRYTVNADGVQLVDGTTLDGMGGFGGTLAVDGGLVYGSGGGIINPSTTPPSQVAVLPLGVGLYGTALSGDGVVPYAAESKSFNVAINNAGTAALYLERFNTQTFTLEQQIAFPTNNSGAAPGTRWGQDGLAYIIPGSSSSSGNASPQIFLIQGPFVLPAEAVSNAAPTVASSNPSTITHGYGNTYVTVTGTGFLPGATVLWNGSPRTTTFVDSAHLTVAIAAADVQTAGSFTVSAQNPGSAASGTITVTVQ